MKNNFLKILHSPLNKNNYFLLAVGILILIGAGYGVINGDYKWSEIVYILPIYGVVILYLIFINLQKEVEENIINSPDYIAPQLSWVKTPSHKNFWSVYPVILSALNIPFFIYWLVNIQKLEIAAIYLFIYGPAIYYGFKSGYVNKSTTHGRKLFTNIISSCLLIPPIILQLYLTMSMY